MVRQVTEVVGSELLDIMAEAGGGLLGSGHTWVGPVDIHPTDASPGPSSHISTQLMQSASQGIGMDGTGNAASQAPMAGRFRDAASVEAEILALVQGFVGPEVSADQPLATQGLDSLAAMELRQKLQVRT